MSNHPELPPTGPEDWDRLIDNPFNIGPFSRSIKADDWWVITGMHVKLPVTLKGERLSGEFLIQNCLGKNWHPADKGAVLAVKYPPTPTK